MAAANFFANVYTCERCFYNSTVLVAINKNGFNTYNVSGLNTALHAGTYSDYLTGTLGGSALVVNTGTAGNNPAGSFNLTAHTVAVWTYADAELSESVFERERSGRK